MEKILPLKPVIMRISGGLGNQLFQYALGRALTLESGAPLLVETSSYANQKPTDAIRTYTLDKFNITGQLATKNDFKAIGIPNPSDNGILAKIRRKLIRMRESDKAFHERKIVLEPTFSFIPDILNIQSGTFLAGVWQSENYFKDHSGEIRKEFTLKNPLSKRAEEIKKMIAASESVTIHVRRGDMASNPYLNKKHGLLTDEYYAAALRLIRERVKDPRFFVFSDDIKWVRENMKLGEDAIYVSESNLPDYEELMLIASCKHQIIANSSFSWWGAWLNSNPNKTVIAPKQWFGAINNQAKDVIPDSWIQL